MAFPDLNRRQKVVIFSLIVSVLCIAIAGSRMVGETSNIETEAIPGGEISIVVARLNPTEVAKKLEAVVASLEKKGNQRPEGDKSSKRKTPLESAKHNLILDIPLIFGYVVLIATLAITSLGTIRRNPPSGTRLKWVLGTGSSSAKKIIRLACFAAILDLVENGILWWFLSGSSGALLAIVLWLATWTKFVTLIGIFVYLCGALAYITTRIYPHFFRYVFFMRVPLFVASLLFGLGILTLFSPDATQEMMKSGTTIEFEAPPSSSFFWFSATFLAVTLAGFQCTSIALLILSASNSRHNWDEPPSATENASWISRNADSPQWWFVFSAIIALPLIAGIAKNSWDGYFTILGLFLGIGVGIGLVIFVYLLDELARPKEAPQLSRPNALVRYSNRILKYLKVRVRRYFQRPFQTIDRPIMWVLRLPASGFQVTDDDDDDLLRRHIRAAYIGIILLFLYVLGFLPWAISDGVIGTPVAIFVLMLIMMLLSAFSYFTFLLDKYRIPLITAVVVLFGVMYTVFPVDHYFELQVVEKQEDRQPVRIDEAIDARIKNWEQNNPERKEREPVVVIICAAGGGIQAAAWTATVLTGLNDNVDHFGESIHLISSTSGGSVGSMFFLDSFGKNGRPIPNTDERLPRAESGTMLKTSAIQKMIDALDASPKEDFNAVVTAAHESSLEEIGWALVYHDTFRWGFPILRFGNRFKDRAWALERVWEEKRAPILQTAKRTPDKDQKLVASVSGNISEWMYQARRGVLPGVVFNSTVTDDGSLLAITTLDFPQINVDDANPPKYTFEFPESESKEKLPLGVQTSRFHDRTFHKVYGKNFGGGQKYSGKQIESVDLEKVTAARLSATFPYITPIARARYTEDRLTVPPSWHLADGGLYDNLGVMAAVEWLRVALNGESLHRKDDSEETKRPVAKILVVQIVSFPPGDEEEDPYSGNGGWINATFGPLNGYLKVRTTSQVSRGAMELDVIRDLAAREEGIEMKTILIRPEDAPKDASDDDPDRSSPPLTRHLTKEQKSRIYRDWLTLNVGPDSPIVAIDTFINENSGTGNLGIAHQSAS